MPLCMDPSLYVCSNLCCWKWRLWKWYLSWFSLSLHAAHSWGNLCNTGSIEFMQYLISQWFNCRIKLMSWKSELLYKLYLLKLKSFCSLHSIFPTLMAVRNFNYGCDIFSWIDFSKTSSCTYSITSYFFAQFTLSWHCHFKIEFFIIIISLYNSD